MTSIESDYFKLTGGQFVSEKILLTNKNPLINLNTNNYGE